MITIASCLKYIASDYWSLKLYDDYGIKVELDNGVTEGPFIIRQIFNILNPISASLIKDCDINTILIRSDMGRNKPFYPNHGYYSGNLIALNENIFHEPDLPDDFIDHRGYFVTRPEQTLLHEFGHAYDEHRGNLSLKSDWLKLSGWSETFQPGLKRIHIQESGAPEVIGEWYYNPEIENGGFTRFYAKRNPWDDWADSFSFFIANIKNKLPPNKLIYFNKLLEKYY